MTMLQRRGWPRTSEVRVLALGTKETPLHAANSAGERAQVSDFILSRDPGLDDGALHHVARGLGSRSGHLVREVLGLDELTDGRAHVSAEGTR